MRVALWSPRTEGGWVAALRPHLENDVRLELVTEEPRSAPTADLHVYHVGDNPEHGFVYRALLRQPGLVVLEEWGLHRLVYAETAGRGNEAEYRREARRAHGELGGFVARQVVRGYGGSLPAALLAMNDRVLDAGLGFIATTEAVHARVAARRPGLPVTHLPLAFLGPPPIAPKSGPRFALGASAESPFVVAIQPADADAPAARVARALDQCRETEPRAAVRWVRADDPALVAYLAAADVVVALEHPPRAGLGAAVPLAVALGRAPLVSAGSGAAREMPEGVVARISPGASETQETVALVGRLLADESLRSRMGALARAYAAQRRIPQRAARVLLELLRASEPGRGEAERRFAVRRATETHLASRARDEITVAARGLGLVDLPPGLAPLASGLFGEDAS